MPSPVLFDIRQSMKMGVELSATQEALSLLHVKVQFVMVGRAKSKMSMPSTVLLSIVQFIIIGLDKFITVIPLLRLFLIIFF